MWHVWGIVSILVWTPGSVQWVELMLSQFGKENIIQEIMHVRQNVKALGFCSLNNGVCL